MPMVAFCVMAISSAVTFRNVPIDVRISFSSWYPVSGSPSAWKYGQSGNSRSSFSTLRSVSTTSRGDAPSVPVLQ